jgi:hypothetical protein
VFYNQLVNNDWIHSTQYLLDLLNDKPHEVIFITMASGTQNYSIHGVKLKQHSHHVAAWPHMAAMARRNGVFLRAISQVVAGEKNDYCVVVTGTFYCICFHWEFHHPN